MRFMLQIFKTVKGFNIRTDKSLKYNMSFIRHKLLEAIARAFKGRLSVEDMSPGNLLMT